MAELALPSEIYKASYIEALREGFTIGIGHEKTPEEIKKISNDFAAHVAGMQSGGKTGKITCPDGKEYDRVPDTRYWLVEGDDFIGEIGLRHKLNDFLKIYGGHIGYGVRPSMRQKGYGALMLKLTLEKARALGLERVMVSCDPENTGSRRIIEANGGMLEKTASYDWTPNKTNIYWIRL